MGSFKHFEMRPMHKSLYLKARPISWAIIKYINLVLELNITY